MVHIFLFFCKFEAKSVELIIIIELSFKNLNLNQKFFKKGHIGAKINLVFGNNNPKCATLKKVIYIIKTDVCQHSNVLPLTSPPVLKLFDSQGYVWLPY